MDISVSFDNTTIELLSQGASLAQESDHKYVSPLHVISCALESPPITTLFTQIRYDRSAITMDIHRQLATFPPADEKKLYFSIDLQKSIFLAYLISQEYQRVSVTVCDLFLALLHSQVAKDLDLSSLTLNPALELEIQKTCGGNLLTESPSNNSETGEMTLLSKYSRNLGQTDISGSILIERPVLLNEMVNNLTRKSQQNILLVGEPGTGKKSLVHLLARRILNGNVPNNLKDAVIREFDAPLLLNSFHTDQRIDLIVNELLNEIHSAGKSIIVFDNMAQLLENDRDLIRSRFIEQFIRKLEESHVPVIAIAQYEKYISVLAKSPLITNGFSVMKIPSATPKETTIILNARKQEFETFYSLVIDANTFKHIIDLSTRYMKEITLPGSVINLLDQLCSQVHNSGKKEVSVDDVRVFISQKTGIPVTRLTRVEKEKFSHLEQDLNEVVKGQDNAVEAVSSVVIRSRAGLKDPKKPIGSFLFLGPSGVGKTFLAKNLAAKVYDDENAMVRIDMSEFGESHTTQRLIGAPPGYVGYEEGGQLTNPVYERPYSLILLDEIEKAHPKVFDVFLQVLDEGHLTDGKGRTVDFKNTIIIMTSNIASAQIVDFFTQSQTTSATDVETFKKDVVMQFLTEHFRVEFINRFDDIVIFNPLSKDMLREIGLQEISKIQEKVATQNIAIEVKESTLTGFIEKAYNPALGARPLIRMLRENIEDNLAQRIVADSISPNEKVTF